LLATHVVVVTYRNDEQPARRCHGVAAAGYCRRLAALLRRRPNFGHYYSPVVSTELVVNAGDMERDGVGTRSAATVCDTMGYCCCSNKLCAWRHNMPPPFSSPRRAPPRRRNIAVLSHAEYVPTLTAAAALCVKAVLSKAAW